MPEADPPLAENKTDKITGPINFVSSVDFVIIYYKMSYVHTPVLLHEVITLLDPQPGQNFVDATLGGGGYTREILRRIGPEGKILAIDLDHDAIFNLEELVISNKERVITAQGNFSQVDKFIKHHNFPAPDGIVADLGLSSHELDGSGRGISFQKHELLDMRFDQKDDRTDARFILNNYDEKRLLKVFEEYGEEKFSRQIVKKITDYRLKVKEIQYTTELYQIIVDALPKPVKHRANDSARKVFQALRIEVNNELNSLREFLEKGFDLLKPGGKMAVVTFHSLEDRIVKHFFVGLTKGCVCPPDFPQCVCGKNPRAQILTKKPVSASVEELEKNSRSKPAKLRAIIKK